MTHRPMRDYCALALGVALACNVTAAIGQERSTERREAPEEIRVQGSRIRPLGLDESNGTGSRLGLTARELPASISIVTQQDMQLRGARTAVEAIEAAVGMTGLTGVGSIPSYATRGFAGADITIMRDGIRQNTSSQASRPLDSFLFDRIEVLKGPASLLYGEGAIGGAVNYVSKQAASTPARELQVSGGSWGRYRAAFGSAGPIGDGAVSYRADLSLSRDNAYMNGNTEQYVAAGGELRWEPGDRTVVRFNVSLLEDDIESYYGTPLIYDAVIGLDGVETVRAANTVTDRLVNARLEPAARRLNYNIADNYSRATNTFWRAIVEHELERGWALRNETYAATQELDWRNAERAAWNPLLGVVERGGSMFLIWRDDLQIGNRLDLSWDGDWGSRRNRFLVGVWYDDNDQDRNSGQVYPRDPLPANLPLTGFDQGVGPAAGFEKTVNYVTRTAAVYVEDVLDLTAKLKLIGGLRYERIDVDRESFVGADPFTKGFSPFTGRVGLIYDIQPRLSVYASYSSAAQPVVQLVSLTITQNDFSLQKGSQFEVGLKTTLWDERAEMTVALFDIEKNDLLTSTMIDGVRFNSQIGAQVAQGAEWEIGVSMRNGWRLGANAAWTWKAEFEEFYENVGTGVISRAGNMPTNVPEIVAGVFAARTWDSWSANATVYHVGERQANTNNGIQVPAYTKLDASVTRRWNTLSATLRGRNLTDETYISGVGGGGLMWRLADPRSVELGMRLEF